MISSLLNRRLDGNFLNIVEACKFLSEMHISQRILVLFVRASFMQFTPKTSIDHHVPYVNFTRSCLPSTLSHATFLCLHEDRTLLWQKTPVTIFGKQGFPKWKAFYYARCTGWFYWTISLRNCHLFRKKILHRSK